MVCGVFGEGRNRLVWVGSHRVQIGSDKKQYAPGDCARRTYSTCAHTLSQFALRALTPGLRKREAAFSSRWLERPFTSARLLGEYPDRLLSSFAPVRLVQENEDRSQVCN